MLRVEDRYHNDPVFKTLVDMLRHLIEKGDYTPTEIREACMLAQVMYEERRVRHFTLDDINQIRQRS